MIEEEEETKIEKIRMEGRGLLTNNPFIFLAVAEEGSMTKAALRLGLSQPAISYVIKKLEKELRAELLVREKGRMVLTQKGMIVKAGAQQLVDDMAMLFNSVKQKRGDNSGD